MASFPFACKWVLSKLNGAVAAVVKGMEAYEFSQATSVSAHPWLACGALPSSCEVWRCRWAAATSQPRWLARPLERVHG